MRRLPNEPVSETYKHKQYLIQKLIQRRIFWLAVFSYSALLFLLLMFFFSSSMWSDFKYRLNGDNCIIHVSHFENGKSILFECEGDTALIDAGGYGHNTELLTFLETEEIKKIDYLVIAEPDEAYLDVFADILDSVEISKIIIPQCDDSLFKLYDDFTFRNMIVLSKAENTPYFTIGKMRFDISDTETMSIEVNFESNSFLIYNLENENQQLEFIESEYAFDSDVLISMNGMLPETEFLETFTPEHVIIYGDSDYKADYEFSGDIYNTFSDGNIIVKSNGVNLKFECKNQ